MRQIIPLVAAVLAVLGLAPSRIHVQTPDSATPAEAVRAAFQAQDQGDWPRFVSLVHPEALEAFKDQILEMAGFRDVMAKSPEPFPGFDAEEYREQNRSFLRTLFRVETVGQAQRLPAAELFARYLASPSGGITEKLVRQVGGSPRPRVVLGVVEQGDSLAHVVFTEFNVMYDEESGDEDQWRERARLVTVRRVAEGGWRVMLNGGLFFDEAGGFSLAYSSDAGKAP